MIKINLMNSSINADSGDTGIVGSEDQVKRRAYTNLAVFMIGPVALWLYAAQAKPGILTQIAAINAQLEELRAFNNKEANIVAEISQINEDEKNVKMRIEALQNVTLGRMAEIKVLDLIQSLIRERMWLTELKIDSGKLEMRGKAQSELDINQFQDDLTKNILFKRVFLKQAESVQEDGQPYTQFTIEALLEKSK